MMTMERWIRLIAGSFVMISLLIYYVFDTRYALLFTAFVGANLFQSALTKWCLMESILAKFGVRPCADARPPDSDAAAG